MEIGFSKIVDMEKSRKPVSKNSHVFLGDHLDEESLLNTLKLKEMNVQGVKIRKIPPAARYVSEKHT